MGRILFLLYGFVYHKTNFYYTIHKFIFHLKGEHIAVKTKILFDRSTPSPLVPAKLSTGLLTPCIEFGWNYSDIFKDITFKLRTEFVFWFAEEKMLLKTET